MLSVVITLAILFTRALLHLSWPIVGSFLLDCICSIISIVFHIVFIEGFSVNRQPIEVLEVGQVAHDQVDLVLCLQIDIKTSQNGHARNGLNTFLEVVKDYIL